MHTSRIRICLTPLIENIGPSWANVGWKRCRKTSTSHCSLLMCFGLDVQGLGTWTASIHTVDGQNPAPTKDDDYPMIYRVLTHCRWCRILSINSRFVVLIQDWEADKSVSQSSTKTRCSIRSGNRPGHPKKQLGACRFLFYVCTAEVVAFNTLFGGTSDNWIVAKVLYTLLVINIFPTKR